MARPRSPKETQTRCDDDGQPKTGTGIPEPGVVQQDRTDVGSKEERFFQETRRKQPVEKASGR